MTNKIQVLIADNQILARQALRSLLEQSDGIEVIGEALNGVDAVIKSQTLSPDVILIEIGMLGYSGIDAIAEIKQLNPHVRVLVLTSFPEERYIFSAIKAGASGYLVKDLPIPVLLNAVYEVARGKYLFDQ